MPKDISSSSSEDEVDDAAAETGREGTTTPEKKTTRYQCPAEFVSFSHKPCSSTFTASLKKNKTELWLIKAPAGFNPECFNGIKVPLSGLQTVRVPRATGVDKSGSRQQIYNILASSHGAAELHLLTAKKQSSDRVVVGPAFSGQLNVSESYGDSSANLAPQVIPAAPAPSIPPGLKQRFHPFGSRTVVAEGVSESETDGSVVRPSPTTVSKRSIDEVDCEREGEGEKKKRKKKEKQPKGERVEELKVETTAEFLNEAVTQLPLQEADVSEKRKKKKKKKDREQGEAEEVTVKVETVDGFPNEAGTELPFQNTEVSEKTKKKKKKKDREREEEEGEWVGVEPKVEVKVEEVVVKCEPTETFCVDETEGSGKKKKKKKKSKNDD